MKAEFVSLRFRETQKLSDIDLTMANRVHHFKLVLLGDTSVGKSCLVVRFVRDEFFEFQEPTIGGVLTSDIADWIPYCFYRVSTWRNFPLKKDMFGANGHESPRQ